MIGKPTFALQFVNPSNYLTSYDGVEIVWQNVPYNLKVIGFSVPLHATNDVETYSVRPTINGRFNLGSDLKPGKLRIGDLKLTGFKPYGSTGEITIFASTFLSEPFPVPSGFSVLSLDLDLPSITVQNEAYLVNEDLANTYLIGGIA